MRCHMSGVVGACVRLCVCVCPCVSVPVCVCASVCVLFVSLSKCEVKMNSSRCFSLFKIGVFQQTKRLRGRVDEATVIPAKQHAVAKAFRPTRRDCAPHPLQDAPFPPFPSPPLPRPRRRCEERP